ncbi:MAG: AEC family transporter, partial [Burkholderiales bacterium]
VAGVFIAMRYFRPRMPQASSFACNCGFPDMAFLGLPVVTVIVGPQGLLPVIVGNILTSILIIPPVMAMLHHSSAKEDPRFSIGEIVVRTFRRPIVWAPIVAFVLALAGFQIPALATASLKLIGGITGGLALLTLGLMLSELTPRFDREGAIISVLKNFVAPAIVVVAAKLLDLPRDLAVGAVIIAACPSATIAAMLSSQFAVARDKIPGQILASNLVAFVSMPLWILIAEKL